MQSQSQTPMMRQFYTFKEQHPNALLLFRCGDFYETYGEDAVMASKILNITLTKRNNGVNAANIEMAGFPYHALDSYLPKLVRNGLRVAICDQLEDPKLTTKLVKRGVTELVTPAVNFSDISEKENNFLCCICKGEKAIGIAFLDISTGEFFVSEGNEDYIEKLLHNFSPKEVLFLRNHRTWFEDTFGKEFCTYELEDWMFSEQSATDRLLKQFDTQTLKGFGIEMYPYGVIAAGGALHYLDITKHYQTNHIQKISRIDEHKYVWLDSFTLRNLEIFDSYHHNGYTLFSILDNTKGAMGSRLLRRWLSFPLKDVRSITNRQSVVTYFVQHQADCATLQKAVEEVQDLERILSKVATKRITPREFLQLQNALTAIKNIKTLCKHIPAVPYITTLGNQITECGNIRDAIKRTIQPNAPALQGKRDTIQTGVDQELDELRDLLKHSREKLLDIQSREIQRTGISSLKIDYNNVFGYFLEVRNTFKHLVPKEWVRKQTLVSAERYITDELKEYEQKILTAEDKILNIENRIYSELIDRVGETLDVLQINANVVAQLDCLSCFAAIAAERNYCCPTVNDDLKIDIKEGRHPVIEHFLPMGEQYVSNDVLLDNEDQQIIILTGPNMSGKSALLRQTAIIVLMAQIGSYVPAKSATIGLVDKIFTRVGASDNISLGESTFMVEMTESASILNNISERSLILFDELGRGTATYDGISIAWAIVEYLHENKCHCKTLFATHYHELNDMAKTFSRIRNYNVSVKEMADKIIFLRKLAPGGAEHSFGIHVAKMAGIPNTIIQRAEQILAQLEAQANNITTQEKKKIKPQSTQLSFFELNDPVLEQIKEKLRGIKVDSITPIEALNELNELQKLLKN